jgi:dihydroxy-acid dehydratase
MAAAAAAGPEQSCPPAVLPVVPPRYVMEDVHKVGGTPAVLKYLNSKGYINADCLTVTGEPHAQECTWAHSSMSQRWHQHVEEPPPTLPVSWLLSGKTMGENLAQVPELRAGQDVILPLEAPIKETGHIQILYGNLAPEGSVAKITGGEEGGSTHRLAV